MKILVITLFYYPDTVSVAQHLSDLCVALAEKGHEVKVITSRHAYEDKSITYPKKDKQGSIEIVRVNDTGFGKGSFFGRILDFSSYYFLCFWRMIFLKSKSYDLVLGLTAPPLLSFMGSWIAKWKKMKFLYWTMDLQPEISIATGILKKESFVAKALTFMGNKTFVRSDKIIVLDRFMKDYAVSRGAKAENTSVVPVWPPLSKIYEGERLENPFRIENNFGDKIVIMYSGNHTFVHPLDTILNLAKELEKDERFLFVFIGSGVAKKDVTNFKNENQLENILQLPYQPREKIHLSLGSSDFQIVVLGEGQVGFTHPNKIYGAMFIGKPIVYVGPEKSHVTDILNNCPNNAVVKHGEVEKLKNQVLNLANDLNEMKKVGETNRNYALENFHPDVLIEKMTTFFDV